METLKAINIALAVLAGVVVLVVLAKALRSRRDSSSSFRAEDFILEEAEITVPVAPGLAGKAVVRKRGDEVSVRATNGASAYARGARVRIIDYQDACYLIEAADEEHLVR